MEPTKKQIDYIEGICEELEIPNPDCKTKDEACVWISEHVDAYHRWALDKQYSEYCSYGGEYEDVYIGF